MKTTTAAMITRVKRQADYNISDDDLDNLIIDKININLNLLKVWLMDRQLYRECSKSESFKTIEDQEFVDITQARIVGNVATFTAVIGDKITVTIDGTGYTTAALTGAVLVATVVTAINLATAAIGDVATESDDGYLVITSPTAGSTSSAVISDNAGTGAARLFTVVAERTQSSIADVDEIVSMTERTNKRPITNISYDEYKDYFPDPTQDRNTTPNFFARLVERFYFGPTPSENILIYIDYIFHVVEVTSASTLPFKNKFDPLIEALCVMDITAWLAPENRKRMTTVEGRVKFWKEELIDKASQNIGMRQPTASRKPEVPYFAPRKVVN